MFEDKKTCAFCGAEVSELHDHYKLCPEYKKFEELIKEIKHKVIQFIKTHNNNAVLHEFYYHIPLEILRSIRYLMEKNELRQNPPRWFKKISEKTIYPHIPCGDHLKWTKEEVWSEPYLVSQKDIESLINFCKAFNLEFYITGESQHFPGHTFRIVIGPKRVV